MTSATPTPPPSTHDREEPQMTDLTARYVHAATRFVQSESERTELKLELRERIEDTVAALEAGGMDHEAAERQALTDLGDPLRLSAEYRQKPAHLIGPRYFYAWLRLLILVVAIAAPIVLVINVLVSISDQAPVGEIIASAFGNAFGVAIQIAFWVTLIFAIVERVAPTAADSWNPDMLPQLPTGSGSNRRSDLIASLVFLTIAAALLVWQQIGSPFFEDGERVPVLDPTLWVPWFWLVLALLVAEAFHAFWVYRDGWTWPATIVNAVLGIAFAAIVVPPLLQDRLLNPELVDLLGWTGMTATTSIATGVFVILVTLWDIGAGVVRTVRGDRRVAAA